MLAQCRNFDSVRKYEIRRSDPEVGDGGDRTNDIRNREREALRAKWRRQ